MRFLFILIFAIPALMAFRTLGLFTDWTNLRRHLREGAGPDAALALSERLPTGIPPDAALDEIRRRLVSSTLATAAGFCFALAGGLALMAISGRNPFA